NQHFKKPVPIIISIEHCTCPLFSLRRRRWTTEPRVSASATLGILNNFIYPEAVVAKTQVPSGWAEVIGAPGLGSGPKRPGRRAFPGAPGRGRPRAPGTSNGLPPPSPAPRCLPAQLQPLVDQQHRQHHVPQPQSLIAAAGPAPAGLQQPVTRLDAEPT